MALKDFFGTKSPFDDLKSTLIAYVKQETLDPAKKLGRYLALGLAGTLLMSLGLLLLALAILRLLQGETGSTFKGHLSWIPYFVVFLFLLAIGGLTLKSAFRKASAKELSR